MRRYTAKQIGPRDDFAFGQASPDTLKNRPQDLALFPADASLATEPGDIPIVLPGRQLPSIHDLAPLADQEPWREPVSLNLGSRLAQ